MMQDANVLKEITNRTVDAIIAVRQLKAKKLLDEDIAKAAMTAAKAGQFSIHFHVPEDADIDCLVYCLHDLRYQVKRSGRTLVIAWRF